LVLKEIWVDIAEEIAKAVDSGSIESTLTNDLTDIATGSKTAGYSFTGMANQIIRAIEQMIIKIMIVEPLMRSLQSAFSGGFNLSGFGFNPIAGATGSAHGNVFFGGKIIPFAQGGVDTPSIAPMVGKAGPEAIVPPKRGADGNLGITASGGGRGVNVTSRGFERQPGG
jgi:phage-related minor tail protein